MEKYDIVIIGGGPGGYVASIKAAQLGKKVALIEDENIGGICLNHGCIPTKAMLKSAKVYKQFMHAENYGLDLVDKSLVKVNMAAIKSRKDKIVKKLTGGVKFLLKKNGVHVINGFGIVIDKTTVKVNDQILKTDNLIIATGSSPVIPPIPGLDDAIKNKIALTSKELLNITKLPKTLSIIGGGVIGIEFATLYSLLGTDVTILERDDMVLSGIDNQIRTEYMKLLANDNLKVITNANVIKIDDTNLSYSFNDKIIILESELILVSIGNKPNLKGLEKLDLIMEKGFIKTDNMLKTNIKNVYAIGDVNGKMMLAHVASAEGITAVNNILGKKDFLNYDRVPSGIYGLPEIAYVGLNEEEAIEQSKDYKVSIFPLSANGKALAEGESEGFIKLIIDKKYGEVLGMHILALNATDMIAEAVTTMELEGTVFELSKAIHPHPTLSEIIMEAAQGAIDKAIHI